MPSGHPLTNEQREYIHQHKDVKFISQMAKELNLNTKTVKHVIDE